MTSPREPEIRRSLRRWIGERSKIDESALRDDTQLVTGWILKSVQVPELLLFIEELRGEPVDVTRLKPGAFSSIDALYSAFFAEGARAEG